MKTIYRSEKAKKAIIDLYDSQISQLDYAYRDIYIGTNFGRTHIVETGNFSAKPLMVFHGGNATTAYNLKYCNFILDDFHVYAVDTIGHPGKSAETSLSPNNLEYGQWVSELITQLGYDKISCLGGSFGGGILVKAMCVSPEKIERSVLIVPAAIKNAPAYKSISMLFPMIMYWITGEEKWFVKCILPMCATEEDIRADVLITARCSIDNARIKKGMPKNESIGNLSKYKSPVLVLAAEKDCLFPGKGVIERSKKAWKQCGTYLLEDRGHINELTLEEKRMINEFLSKDSWDMDFLL